MFKLTTDPNIPESILPTRGSVESAGWDLYATSSIILERSATLDTGIRIVELPINTYVRIASRSGLASKHSIQVLGGVVDRDYVEKTFKNIILGFRQTSQFWIDHCI